MRFTRFSQRPGMTTPVARLARLALRGGMGGLAVLGVLGLAGCGGQAKGTVRLGTGQLISGGPHVSGAGGTLAGVLWTGAVRAIGADWRVPAIRAGSQPGRASTWIGAQGNPLAGSSAFIQIGTQEELRRGSRAGTGTLFYAAFWSDVVRGFHPVGLFSVQPGDEIAARMSLHGQRWTLTIADETTGASRRVSTAEEGTGRFRLGEWLQEDATRSATANAFAYPDIVPVRISALEVNAHAPALTRLNTQWMALPRAYVGPTAPARDAFRVVPQAITAAGARYLRIAGPVDSHIDHFLRAAATWRAATSRSVIVTATTGLIAALKSNDAHLGARRWPVAVAASIHRLTDIFAAQVARLRRAVAVGPAAILAALAHGLPGAEHAALTRSIRAGLGLPQVSS